MSTPGTRAPTDNVGGIFNTGGTVDLFARPAVNTIPDNCLTSAPTIPGCLN